MDVKLPSLGEGVDSGAVVSILVKEGDQINKGQTILELENEKAVAPIPSPASGRVDKIRVKEGDKVTVGQSLITLSEEIAAKTAEAEPKKAGRPKAAPAERKEDAQPAEDEQPAAETGTQTEPEAEPESEQSAPEAGKPGAAAAAAPSIRKLARELGIDLARVQGSERGGRIVLADLKAYIQRLQKLAFAPKTAGAKPERPAAAPVDFSKWGPISKKPMSPLRKVISRRMTENWNTIPHVTQFAEADITQLEEWRKKHGPAYEAKGARLTLTALAVKIVAEVLKKFPALNSSLDEATDEIVLKEYFHIGIAVDTDAGLVVPVIRDADKKDLLELSKEINELAEKARERKLAADEMKGGSFTISNQGGIGGAHFTPIVNKPEAAILGLGRGAQKPVFKDSQVTPRLLLPLCLSYDHRLIDGGTAARFIVELAKAFEAFDEETIKRGVTK